MSEQKERGDVEQALNELEQATELGNEDAVKGANKRLDALGVPVKRRAARLRKLAAEESGDDSPKSTPPAERKSPGPTAKA